MLLTRLPFFGKKSICIHVYHKDFHFSIHISTNFQCYFLSNKNRKLFALLTGSRTNIDVISYTYVKNYESIVRQNTEWNKSNGKSGRVLIARIHRKMTFFQLDGFSWVNNFYHVLGIPFASSEMTLRRAASTRTASKLLPNNLEVMLLNITEHSSEFILQI